MSPNTHLDIKNCLLSKHPKCLDSESIFKILKSKKESILNQGNRMSLFYYLNGFIKNYSFFYNKFSKKININFLYIDQKNKQPYFTLNNGSSKTLVNYSIGLVLCASGIRIKKLYKPVKKQKKGLIKTLNFSKRVIFDKFFFKTDKKRFLGLIFRGKPRYLECYTIMFSYFRVKNIPISFISWIPKIRFSFIKMKKYGRIKRNLRKRIVKMVVSSTRAKKQASSFSL